jgi:hypothetical protein
MDLVSQCALRVAKVVWRPGHGGFAFTVVCKATFDLTPVVSLLAAEQEPVALADAYVGDGGELAVASDLVPVKKRPEVLLTGHAYAPEGKPVPSLLARLVVGEIDKSIQVVGDRHFGRDGRLSEPEPFARMPLGWERADGGPDTFNPAGRSLGSAARPDAIGRVPAPNLLPAGLWLKSRSDVVSPVGFGPIAPLWPSRAACLQRHAAGWDPGRWNERPLPADVDLGYFNAAPSDQQRALPFGEEMIYLEHLHPRIAHLSTRLAQVTPVATVDHGAGPQALQLRCDTLIIDSDRGLAMLVWRGHVLLDHQERPGRVVVTGPAAAKMAIPAWATNVAANVFDADAEVTLVPSAFKQMAAVLPFSGGAAGASEQAVPAERERVEVRPRALDSEESGTMTLAAGFAAVPAVVLPFVAPQVSAGVEGDGPATARRDVAEVAPPQQHQQESWGGGGSFAVERMPEVVAPPLMVMETPAPPALIGPIAIVSAEVAKERDGEAAAVAVAVVEAAEPEVEIDVEAYPPSRCGGIAGHVACAGGDAGKVGEILRAEGLDAGRWERVHGHWLGRIREEAARSRKALMAEYDGGYVGAIEGERGAIGVEEYARLAEAAERGEVAGALVEGGLPEGGWVHIHRVWIGRMVKDVRVGKQVRGAIEGRRAAG